jgi:hypothetical protein
MVNVLNVRDHVYSISDQEHVIEVVIGKLERTLS